MEISGKVHEIGETIQVTDTFKKRDLVVQYAENPQFVEYIKFEANQDRVSLFDNLSPGDDVTVSFNLRGRPWTNREGVTTYFNTLVAWRVNHDQSNTAEQTQAPAPKPAPSPVATEAEDDDLPFS